MVSLGIEGQCFGGLRVCFYNIDVMLVVILGNIEHVRPHIVLRPYIHPVVYILFTLIGVHHVAKWSERSANTRGQKRIFNFFTTSINDIHPCRLRGVLLSSFPDVHRCAKDSRFSPKTTCSRPVSLASIFSVISVAMWIWEVNGFMSSCNRVFRRSAVL